MATSSEKKIKTNNKPKFSAKYLLLEAKTNGIFEIVQDIYDLSLKVSDPQIKLQFLSRIHSLDELRSSFINTLDEFIMTQLEDDPSSKPNYSALKSFDELHCYIKQTVSALNPPPSNRSDNSKFDLFNRKLPPLKLVSFDGTPSKWSSFYENFKSLIHDNPQLSEAEKVQYLIGCLSDKALTVCSGIVPTAVNYLIIWNALLEKYQDQFTLINLSILNPCNL